MGEFIAQAPCKSCPYRCDVPSGLWAAEEYDKLPLYDGDIGEQIVAGATALFMCHQQDGKLCAGWVAAHGAVNLAACRLHDVGAEVFSYQSPVPVFSSGQDASDHGRRDISAPGIVAKRAIDRLVRKAKVRARG